MDDFGGCRTKATGDHHDARDGNARAGVYGRTHYCNKAVLEYTHMHVYSSTYTVYTCIAILAS